MKILPARSTASKLEAAESALVAVERRLVELEGERGVALTGDDLDAGALTKISGEIARQNRLAADLRDRIAALSEQQRQEQAEERQRDYLAAIAKIELPLSILGSMAGKVENAIAALGQAVAEFDEATTAVLRIWPPNVTRFFVPYHLDASRLGEQLRQCLTPYSNLTDKKPAKAYVDEASEAAGRIKGFAAAERKHHAELLDELREFRVPEPEPETDEAEEAAA